MRSVPLRLPFSPIRLVGGIVAILSVTYIGLIAVVMSYAALTIEFSQSVKNDEASVAALESEYFSTIARITNTDYRAAGYAPPLATTFVRAKSPTASR